MIELPRPDDPELEVLYEQELYEKHYAAACVTVKDFPGIAARVIAEAWLQNSMFELLRGSIR